MPKYTPKTAKLKAEFLVKKLMDHGFNETKTARDLGITQQAIHSRMQRKPVQDCLQRYIHSTKLKRKLVKVANEGLDATKVVACNIIAPDGEGMKDANSMTKDFIDVPDHQTRHKFWHDLMAATGELKGDSEGGTVHNSFYFTHVNIEDVKKMSDEKELIQLIMGRRGVAAGITKQ